MKITIESTGNLTHIVGIPVRVWNGVIADGTPCLVFVHRIAVRNDANAEAFDKELKEQLQPGQAIDLRYIL
jgi:hypothetical protein